MPRIDEKIDKYFGEKRNRSPGKAGKWEKADKEGFSTFRKEVDGEIYDLVKVNTDVLNQQARMEIQKAAEKNLK